MSIEIKALPDGNSQVNLTPDQLAKLIAAESQMRGDMKLIKENVMKMCNNLGLVNPDGTFTEKISMIKLTPKLFGYISNMDKAIQDFGFMKELLPLLQRYENL